MVRTLQKIAIFSIAYLLISTFSSEYDICKNVFVNSYPWLFPGGIGDIYDLERGKVSIQDWGKHLLQYFDGRFLNDPLFGLFLYNTMQRHSNNSEGIFFLASDQFIGQNPPTVQELKKQLKKRIHAT